MKSLPNRWRRRPRFWLAVKTCSPLHRIHSATVSTSCKRRQWECIHQLLWQSGQSTAVEFCACTAHTNLKLVKCQTADCTPYDHTSVVHAPLITLTALVMRRSCRITLNCKDRRRRRGALECRSTSHLTLNLCSRTILYFAKRTLYFSDRHTVNAPLLRLHFRLSVRPSVCLSVCHMRQLWLSEQKTLQTLSSPPHRPEIWLGCEKNSGKIFATVITCYVQSSPPPYMKTHFRPTSETFLIIAVYKYS